MQSVILVDDHEIFRDGIKSYLNAKSNFNVLGEAAEVEKAIQLIDVMKPDIAVLDLSLNNESGIEILKHYSKHPTQTKMVVLSMHDDAAYFNRCLEYNAQAYVLKSESGQELLKAIEKVAAGEFYLSHRMSRHVVNRFVKRKPSQPDLVDVKITKREIEILNQINSGLSTTQIAEKLHISRRTVETHRTNLFRKLVVKNSIELINKARELSIID